jgi:hypothetical protein
MAKKKIFIGSSSEALSFAEDAKLLLEKDFDITIWNENVWDAAVFKVNQNFLFDLLKATLQFDFGILLGTSDDKVKYRGKEVLQPRDNVIFELGLFTGRLGISNCAFVIDEELKLPSDFSGISLARFDKKDKKSLNVAIEQIKAKFLATPNTFVNFFPSATLAAVYFENLLAPVCRFIIENGGFNFKDTNYKKCSIKVILPEQIHKDVNLQFEQLKGKFATESATFRYAGRPRSITVDTNIKGDEIELIDFPTILAGINYAIANLLPDEFNSSSPDYDSILNRELGRFEATLETLLQRNGFKNIVKIVKEAHL